MNCLGRDEKENFDRKKRGRRGGEENIHIAYHPYPIIGYTVDSVGGTKLTATRGEKERREVLSLILALYVGLTCLTKIMAKGEKKKKLKGSKTKNFP